MKHFLKIFLILTLCVVFFAACDGGDEPTTTTDPSANTPPASQHQVIIKADGTTDYAVITPLGLSGDNRLVVLDFIEDVRKKTGTRLAQRQESDQPENDYEITLNVTRHREDAASKMETTPYTNYRIDRNGNRIIITAFSDDGLMDALTALYKQIKKDATTGTWGIPLNYSLDEPCVKKSPIDLSLMTNEEKSAYYAFLGAIANVPKFSTQNGLLCSLYSLGNDGYAIAVKNTNRNEYEAYVATLIQSGFVQYSTSNMSAGNNVSDVNTYHTFTADNLTIFTQWQPNLKVVRIYITPPAALPLTTPPTLEASDTVPVSIAQMHLAYDSFGGMGYVYQLADGKFILVDGGVWHQDTQTYLANYLREKAEAAGMEKPVIEMWIFSHPHSDHIGLASGGFLDYAKENGIDVKSFAYNFADQNNTSDSHASQIRGLKTMIAELFPDATVYTPRAGQTYYFKGMEIEFLATGNELYPFESESKVTQNSLCMTWRLKFGDNKTAMFLADNTVHINAQLANVYREYLKSDVLQVAHHGLSGGELSCYQYIDPDICLWPSPYDRFMGLYGGTLFNNTLDKDQWGLGYSFVLDKDGNPIDEEGNPTNDPALAKKNIISKANVWLLDESIKDRIDLHNNETAVVGADLSITIIREPDSGLKIELPPLEEGETPDYKAGVIPYTAS